MAISDQDLLGLPDAPEEAFVRFEQLARERLDEAVRNSNGEGWDFELDYMSEILGAAKAYDIEELSGYSLPQVDGEVGQYYRQFRLEVKHLCTQFRIKHSQRKKRSMVAFDPATKVKLRHFLGQMREVVDNEVGLTPLKRQALFARIADLSKEVDSDWSRVETYGALAIAVADATGEAVDRLEPLRKWVDSIGALFGKARREQEEQKQLPPQERRRIEPPKSKPIPPKEKVRPEPVDDEIPF